MTDQPSILLGKGDTLQYLNLKYANRHGLIAGATGTGKTVSLQVLAQGFSDNGVPVFVADVKGDLSGISQPGKPHPKVDERIETIGMEHFAFAGSPTICWDLYGKQGHPVRVSISEMGPVLLSRLLRLTDAQEGVLTIAFALADDDGLLLLDLKDLRAILQYIYDEAQEVSAKYGHISKASIGAIQRRLLQLEQEGASQFFGEPALDISDLMRCDNEGRGYINLLAANELIASPLTYSTFLLWLLAELFETLPEVGDQDKPKLVFFFDEAHLLFDNASKALLEKVEQVIRLIRSKGVGIYFVTQSPSDVPVDVLGQLGNRVQHALRAFTPKDQQAVRTAAQTFRPNPKFDTAEAITQLGVGEALVSTLEAKGAPSIVDRTLICPPTSRIGPITPSERQALNTDSPVAGIYDEAKDPESAYEILAKKAEQAVKEAEKKGKIEEKQPPRERVKKTEFEKIATSVGRSMLTYALRRAGYKIIRGVLGSIMK